MKLRYYNNFRQKLHESARENGFPLRVIFELTYNCNFRCKHCYIPFNYRRNKTLKTKDIFIILDQLKDINCFYLGFTGGEPFIREDILEILWYAKKKGFEIIIYTNGALINERIVKELQRIRPNKVDITIPAITGSVFDRITGKKGSKEGVFEAVKLLNEKRINLGFKTCLLKENEHEIEKIQDFAISLGAHHRLDDLLSPRLDGGKEPYMYRGKVKDILCRDSGLVKKTKIKYIRPNRQNLFKCGVGVNQAAISPLGELKMCLMIDYPKYQILKSSLKKCWEQLKELVRNIQINERYQCDNCDLKFYCKWCPARGWLRDKSFISCDPENYRYAKIKKQAAENLL